MNISKLNIDSYKHLQNINFDFTYPEGHKKEGQSLNKICIIGQSATGKTSILELIKTSISYLNEVEIINNNFFFNHFNSDFNGEIEFFSKDLKIQLTKRSITYNGRKINYDTGIGGSVTKLINDVTKLLYLSSDLISTEAINIFNQNPLSILNELSFEKNAELKKKFADTSYIYQFGQEVNSEIWFSLLYKILDYRKRFTQMASELINKGAIGDLTKLNKEYNKWSENNENPLVSFANYFNPILKKLNLEVDLINTEYTIPIKSGYNDETIPISNLSTGTKGLLLSMFPLYELDTTDSIILVDEPERSLFPDMQIDLISHYQNLAPNAQLIVATHSPFIAAAFEPEERFILYFNENGKVAVRKGESPIGDDPNDILRNDFNVEYYNDFGKKAYNKYLDLKRKVTLETEPYRKKKLVIELSELGDKYNF
ncbi:ATP-binding protein [Mucilaginibacter sp.]|uniref:ATP-binding protein n=1 Tax=Mucilaginibacter sp. TaxID=1882438 RepID=UPI003B006688